MLKKRVRKFLKKSYANNYVFRLGRLIYEKWYVMSVLTLFFLSTLSGSFAASFTPDTGDVINVNMGDSFKVSLNRPGWVGGMTTDVLEKLKKFHISLKIH